jgi:hypothetical protein
MHRELIRMTIERVYVYVYVWHMIRMPIERVYVWHTWCVCAHNNPPDDIEGHVCARMTQVSRVVNCGATRIPLDRWWWYGDVSRDG